MVGGLFGGPTEWRLTRKKVETVWMGDVRER